MHKRVEKARDLFLSGFNCSQSVLGAFNDIFGIDDNTAFGISAGLGSGVGRLRNVCGGVSAASMIIGLVHGAREGSDTEAKAETYRIVREFAEKVTEIRGSYICSELMQRQSEKSYIPEERTEEYYKKRPCVAIVMTCAELICEYLEEWGIDTQIN